MMQTVTQFAAAALGISDYPAPEKKHAGGETCWLCGGAVIGGGWLQSEIIAPTFTQHNTAKCNDSDTVCQSCAALTSAAVYQGMVTARELPIKIWSQAGWHSYSHMVLESGYYTAPTRKQMRELVMLPPAGRWLLCINTSGKKHTIFRATVASSQSHYPVQMDEVTIWMRHDDLKRCMCDFEAMTALGFSKDGCLTGDYHPAQLLKVGLGRWSQAEAPLKRWRSESPDLLELVHFVAHGPSEFEEVEAVTYQKTEAKTETSAPAQMELF